MLTRDRFFGRVGVAIPAWHRSDRLLLGIRRSDPRQGSGRRPEHRSDPQRGLPPIWSRGYVPDKTAVLFFGMARNGIAARRRAAAIRGNVAEDLRRLCADAGVSQGALARASGVPQAFISRILAEDARPSLETYGRLADALGADLSVRLYPNTGPRIRDRHQAPILEGLLTVLHPRWRPFSEVAVHRPARGWIDVLLHEPRERIAVATEIESDLRRIEQVVRWSRAKADSLESWNGWAPIEEPTAVSQLLLVRRTRANRTVATDFARQLAAAYPAHPDDAVAALTGTRTWPGAALVWVELGVDGLRFLHGR